VKCGNHPGVDAIAECSGCSEPLCGICADFTGSEVLCETCVKNQENSAFVDAQNQEKDEFSKMLNEPEAAVKQPKRQSIEESIERREKIHIAIVIIGCIFIGFRLFTDIGSIKVLNAREIQAEELEIERQTLCVQVFWEISAVLQRGEEPDASLRCLETPAVNIITRVDGDIIVTHPNPKNLGFSELYVSKNNPTPTVKVL
jgi:hypothetical protein